MLWVITNGKNYIKRDSKNSVSTTRIIRDALTFEERSKVDNFCASLPKSFKNLCYYPTQIEEKQEEKRPGDLDLAVSADLPEPDISLFEYDYFVGMISDFGTFIHKLVEQRPLLVSAQKKTDDEILDIEHAAEFSNCNAAEGYKLYRMLRDARLRRRRYKDAIAWIDIVIDGGPIKFVESRAENRIKGMQSRKYAPRALPELFSA